MSYEVNSTEARAVFERYGLRCTKQREVIYAALAATKSHPTADELFHAVIAVEPGLSLATVYNALEAFSEVGLVRRLPCHLGSGACRFDADTTDHVHVARSDGRIEDVPHELSSRLLSSIPSEVLADMERRMGIRIEGLSVQLNAKPDQPPAST